jgi:hypothetical protein
MPTTYIEFKVAAYAHIDERGNEYLDDTSTMALLDDNWPDLSAGVREGTLPLGQADREAERRYWSAYHRRSKDDDVVEVPRDCLRILTIDSLRDQRADLAPSINQAAAIHTACEALGTTPDELLPEEPAAGEVEWP